MNTISVLRKLPEIICDYCIEIFTILFICLVVLLFHLSEAAENKDTKSKQYVEQIGKPINELKCEEYLKFCRASCGLRGGMYKFVCLGENFPLNRTRYNCACSDDLGEQL